MNHPWICKGALIGYAAPYTDNSSPNGCHSLHKLPSVAEVKDSWRPCRAIAKCKGYAIYAKKKAKQMTNVLVLGDPSYILLRKVNSGHFQRRCVISARTARCSDLLIKLVKVKGNVASKKIFSSFLVCEVYSARDRWSSPSLKWGNLERIKQTVEQ